MAVRCPQCKREFDVTLFEFNQTVTCVCGHVVTFQHRIVHDELSALRMEEENRISEIKKMADRISSLIVSTEYTKTDIEIEKEKLRDRIHTLFPDMNHLYELIYEPRFKRLEEQFRD